MYPIQNSIEHLIHNMKADAEGLVSAESVWGWRWEDVTGAGIMLDVAKTSQNDMLDVEASGVNGKDQRNSILFLVEGGVRAEIWDTVKTWVGIHL